jgi:hypothetical protein
MRVFWEKLGVLGPIYGLVGQGLSDSDIARKLNLTESTVRGCIGWILRFLQFTERKELMRHSSAAGPTVGSRDRLARHIGSTADRIQEAVLPVLSPSNCQTLFGNFDVQSAW